MSTMRTAAESVMSTLRDAGFEAFFVGGVVRDLVLGKEPKDYDVTTNARPEQVTPLFDKTIPVGVKFGVVVVMVDTHQIEIATYRADGAYSDGRRPDEVVYSQSAKDDVTRRDFTMNGLLLPQTDFSSLPEDQRVAADEDENVKERIGVVVDYVGGMDDIRNKIIRCIGDPNTRFEEDQLRMLRAVRFVAQLGFEIEEETFKAIQRNVDSLGSVSRERIAEELKKLTTGKFAVKGLAALVATGLFRRIFPSLFDKGNVGLMLERFAQNQASNPVEGLAMLMADCRDREAVAFSVDSLKLSREESDTIRDATYFRPCLCSVGQMEEGDFRLFARTNGLMPLGANLFEQDLGLGLYSIGVEAGMANVMRLRVLTKEDIYPAPLVTGKELIAMGMTPSPLFARILKSVEYKQLNGELKTNEEAVAFVTENRHIFETLELITEPTKRPTVPRNKW